MSSSSPSSSTKRNLPSSLDCKSDTDTPWIEKHRPRLLSEIVGNQPALMDVINTARRHVDQNLILTGPPGTGKTSAALCMGREFLKAKFSTLFMEVNASDSSTVGFVRTKIKSFCRRKVEGKYKNIVLLDEADNMSATAQRALCGIMEGCSRTARFIFTCNVSTSIIEPVQSRCCVIRFGRLNNDDIQSWLTTVLTREGVGADRFTSAGLDAICESSGGDLRCAVNNLQAVVSGFDHVVPDNVYKIVHYPPRDAIDRWIEACAVGDIGKVVDILQTLWAAGHVAEDITTAMLARARTHLLLTDEQKMELSREIGHTHIAIVSKGVATLLQLTGLAARMCSVCLRLRPVIENDCDIVAFFALTGM